MWRLGAILYAWLAMGQTQILPVGEVRPGMRGAGYTVFAGEKIEQFDVEILGVLENAGPKQAIVLARLAGGPLAHTGVMQGMSGSPVYVNGKLLGAVALAFSLSKDPIAGIRPFEEMRQPQAGDQPLRASADCAGQALLDARSCTDASLLAGRPTSFAWGQTRLTEIATPVSFSGFTQTALDAFASRMRALGLEPRQGVTGGASARLPDGDPRTLRPGAMISVQLVSGDMSIGAEGTLTHIEGTRVYAFGHRFISLGDVEMPFASAEVLTLLPNLATSFKISAARRLMGIVTHDYNTAVRGEIGRKADLIPVSVSVGGGGRASRYQLEMVRDPVLTPFLLQMAVFSAIDATERIVGQMSYGVRQRIDFMNAAAVDAYNIYSGDFNVPMLAAQSGAIPLAYSMQPGFADLRVKRVEINVQAWPGRRQLTIESVTAGRSVAQPGESIPLTVVFAADGERVTRTIQYPVAAGAPAGNLHFTVADGPSTNLTELRDLVFAPPKSAAHVVNLLGRLRGNTQAYLRVWRAEASYKAQGEDLPAPPPSAAMLLARSEGPSSGAVNYNSKIAEFPIGVGEFMITGNKTVFVEVKQ